MKKIFPFAIVGLLAFCSCSCKGTSPEPDPEPSVVYDATLWTTTFDKSRDFVKSGVAFDQLRRLPALTF